MDRSSTTETAHRLSVHDTNCDCDECRDAEAALAESRRRTAFRKGVTEKVREAIDSVAPSSPWESLADMIEGGLQETAATYLGLRKEGGSCWKNVTHRPGTTYSGPCGKWGCANGKGSGGYCTERNAMEMTQAAVSEWLDSGPVLIVEGEDRVRGYLDAHPDIRLKSRKAHTRKGKPVAGYGRTPGVLRVEGWGNAWLFVPDERGTTDPGELGRKLGEAILGRKVTHRAPKEDAVPYVVAVPAWWSEADIVAAQDWPTVRESRRIRRATRRPTDEEWKRYVRRVRGIEPVPRPVTVPAMTPAGVARAPTTF